MDSATTISQFKEFINLEYLSKVLEQDYLEIDFYKLAKFNPELSEAVLDDPKDAVKCAELAAEDLIDRNIERFQILFINLPLTSKIPLDEIGDQLNKLLSFDGYIVRPSEVYLKCIRGKFECPSCGNIINVSMPGREWKEPTRCGCGRKGKFRLLSKKLVKFMRLELLQALDNVPDRAVKLTKKKVTITGELVRKELCAELQPGQRVEIVGFLDIEELKGYKQSGKSNEYRTHIIANNVIPIESSWESIKLKKSQKEKIREMAKDPELLNQFALSLAPSFEGYMNVRSSLILQLVGGKRILDENGTLEERQCIHILLSGNPGVGKTFLMKRTLRISPLWHWTQGSGLTKAGLVACISKDEFGNFALEVGPLVMANKGILGIDEMEKMNKIDFGMLNNAMNDEQTKITKANIDQTLKTETSILATSNPLHKKFIPEEPIIPQLSPIPQDILDRNDLIWIMNEKIDSTKIGKKYMLRHNKDRSAIKQQWSNEEMRNYISYSRKLIPNLSDASVKFFSEQFDKLMGRTAENNKDISHRLRGNILRLAYAHAKFIGVGKETKENEVELTPESITLAFNLIRDSFRRLEVITEEGIYSYEKFETIPGKKQVKVHYALRDILRDLAKENSNCVPLQTIMEKMHEVMPKFTEAMLDDEIEKLKRGGVVFEPRRGFYGML